MTPSAHIAATIEILDLILSGQSAEVSINKWVRSNRFAGSSDRRAIRDLVFDALRQKNSLIKQSNSISGRAWVIALLRGQCVNLDQYFGTSEYGPPKLTVSELNLLPVERESDLHDIQDWLWPKWKESLGKDAENVAYTLKKRANIFLRVNTNKGNREQSIDTLEKDGIISEPHPNVCTALKVTKGSRKIRNSQAYKTGLVEIQDASSQASVLSINLNQNGPILDFCAGGGGKALALNAYFKQPIYAHDANVQRMKDLPLRAKRSGSDIRIVKSENLKKSFYGLVFCDVPCSGSGAWRRDPEGKWSLTQKKYENLLLMQEDILVTAANLIKPGGYLVYATCSVLIDENGSQVRKFLKNFSEWTIEQENFLIPNSLGDGFYFSVLKKLAKN